VFSSRFPPGYPIALALGQRLLFWVEPYWAQRWTSVALGTAGAVLTAALAWRLTSTATVRTRVVATVATGVVIACHPPVGEATEPFTLGPSFGTSLEAELNAAQLRAALRRIGDDPVPSLTAIPFRWARGIGVLTTDDDRRLPLVAVFLLALAWRRSRLGTALRDIVVPARLVPAGFLAATWIVLIAATYGSARFRQPVEPVFAVACGLAAAAIDGAARSRRITPEVTPGR
jgi:hypothetical protein